MNKRQPQPSKASDDKREWGWEARKAPVGYIAGLYSGNTEIYRQSLDCLADLELIADAHNTALTAEHDRYIVSERAAFKISEQLAAERRSREQADRELSDLAWRYGEQHDRLQSALAAIEKHNNSGYGGDHPIKVDLSVLHKHDEKLTAEARKPLVTLLKRFHYGHRGVPIAWPSREDVADALAKINDGRPMSEDDKLKIKMAQSIIARLREVETLGQQLVKDLEQPPWYSKAWKGLEALFHR